MQLNTGVFDRNGADEVGERTFYFLLSAAIAWGLGLTYFAAKWAMETHYMPGGMAFILLGLVIPIIGIIITVTSDNAFVSFIGYNMVVIPFGVVLGPVLNTYSPNVIANTAMATGGITLFMGTASVMFPSLFKNLGAPLFIALIGLLGIRIAQIFIPSLQSMTWVDYVAAGIFSLYIGFDMYRASEVPRTIDNAVDIAVDLYLDIINLFLSLLRIMGSSSSDD